MDNGRAFDLFPAEAILSISQAGLSAATPMRPSFSIATPFPPIRPLIVCSRLVSRHRRLTIGQS
jgi:hypothetical protein